MNSTCLERLVIFAADKEGHIPVPKGRKSGLQTIRKALAQLKKWAWCVKMKVRMRIAPPYVLTDLRENCREYMISGTIRNEVNP